MSPGDTIDRFLQDSGQSEHLPMLLTGFGTAGARLLKEGIRADVLAIAKCANLGGLMLSMREQGKEDPELLRAIVDDLCDSAGLPTTTHLEHLLKLAEAAAADIGRRTSPELKGTLPLVLYFKTAAERQEFLELMKTAKPDMVSRPI